MCGFAGFTNFIKDDGTVLEKMMNRIVHRGPDSQGKFVDGDIALGFRRLSIIDLAEGDQPMFNEDLFLTARFITLRIYVPSSLRRVTPLPIIRTARYFSTATSNGAPIWCHVLEVCLPLLFLTDVTAPFSPHVICSA